MNILKLERYLQIDFSQSGSIETIRLKYNKLLHLLNFKTDAEANGIYFKRVPRSTKYSARDNADTMNIFREGSITIFLKNDKMHINWLVNLDILYFLSGLIGLVIGFTVNLYFNFPLFLTVISGLGGTIMSIMIGIFTIIIKIDEINDTCLLNYNKFYTNKP